MTITLVRPMDLTAEFILATLGTHLDSVECAGCYTAAALSEDAARDDLGWDLDEDGLLWCESCADDAGQDAYSAAYWG